MTTTSTDSRRTRAELGCVGEDPLEAAAVRAGWQLVGAYERLSTDAAAKLFERDLEAMRDRARTSVRDLQPWDGVARNLHVYQNDSNRLRFMRTLDLVLRGESVFDVGSGSGYLCGLLLRDRGVKSYRGIDIVPEYAGYVRNMINANDLSSENVHVEMGDIYALDRETVTATGATVVICCEVLEHLPDPERALVTLAEALPKGADLVFSVPLYGRLENVWGHRTIYDVARLQAMCESAGLFVHHVEPLANTWILLVASRSREASHRVRHDAGSSDPVRPTPIVGAYDFVPVKRSEIGAGRWVVRADCRVIPDTHGNVRCDATGQPVKRSQGGQYGGVAFPVSDPVTLRVRLGLPDNAPIRNVYVDMHDGDRRIARWRWQPSARLLTKGKTRTWAFRLGRNTAPFTYQGSGADEARIDRVEVFVELAPGEQVSFTVGAAYVPGGTGRPVSQEVRS